MKFVLDSAIRFGFDLAVKATFVFAFTSVALLLMRRSSAATRHRVGAFGLGAALLLPLLSAGLPQVSVPILPDVRPAAPSRSVLTDSAPAFEAVENDDPAEVAISSRELALAVPEKAISLPADEPLASEASPAADESTESMPSEPFAGPAVPRGFAAGQSLLLLAWIAGAAALAFRLAVGWSRVRRIGREARAIRDVEWLLERDAAARRLDVSRRVELVESESVPVAMTFGILRPLLMFGRAARQWAVERRRVVLLHELAHVKRADWPILLLAELSAAVYWFHPLAWWLTRRVRRDAETACDDLVIASGTKPSVYAGHLLGIFRSLGSPAHPTPALALGLGGTRPHHFEERLRTILDPHSSHQGESRGQTRLAVITLAGAATLMGFVSPWAPQCAGKDEPASFASEFQIASLDTMASPSPSASPSESPSPSASMSPSSSPKHECKSKKVAPAAEPSGFLPVVVRVDDSAKPQEGAEAAPEETPAPEATPEAAPEAVPAIWTPAASPSGKVEGFVQAKNGKRHGNKDGSDWYGRGMDLHHDGDYEAAIEAFQKSIEAGYNEDAATYNIACGYALLGKNDLAFEYLKKAMDEGFDVGGYLHDDDLDGLHSDPRWAQLKKEARENGDGQYAREAKAAANRYQRVVARNPKSGEAFFDVGLELLRSEQYDLSAQAYQAAIDRGYRAGTAYYNQACAYALADNKDAAFGSLRKALDNGFDSADHLAKDDDLDNLHGDPRWAQIKKDAKELSLPGYNQNWWNAGSRSDRAKWRDAAERAQKYVEKNPQSGRGWYNLGFASLAGDRPEDSIEAFQKALGLGYRKSATMYNIACGYSRLDQKDAAFDWLNRAIEAGFDDTHTIRSDEDLDNLRGDPRYRKALQTARAAERGDNGEDSE